MNVRTLHIVGWAGVVISIFLAALSIFIPVPSNLQADSFHSNMVISTLIVYTHMVGAVLFVFGLGGFTAKLKTAYWFMVFGFVSLAVGFAQIPFLSLVNLQDTAWVKYGLVAIPFAMSIFAVYIGVRGFAHLFNVRNVFTSLFAVLGLSALLSFIATFLPNGTPNIPMLPGDVSAVKAAVMFPAVINLCATILSYYVHKRAGASYIPATAWLYVYLMVNTLTTIAGIIIRYSQPGQNDLIDNGLMVSGYIISGIALIVAAIKFNEIRVRQNTVLGAGELDFFGNPKKADAEAVAQTSLVDVVTYTAGLASNATNLDNILDDLRIVTASTKPGQPFDEAQQERLAQVYLQLEAYLAHKEPVRPFSQEELRSMIQARFGALLTEHPTFVSTTEQAVQK